mmetsp:Transcript_8198/g.17572  ORF Transcript_8198/g.17572 Transcript_8198/m.17572 type:complete len:236 (+) Transcript_8198:3132-3839(+)
MVSLGSSSSESRLDAPSPFLELDRLATSSRESWKLLLLAFFSIDLMEEEVVARDFDLAMVEERSEAKGTGDGLLFLDFFLKRFIKPPPPPPDPLDFLASCVESSRDDDTTARPPATFAPVVFTGVPFFEEEGDAADFPFCFLPVVLLVFAFVLYFVPSSTPLSFNACLATNFAASAASACVPPFLMTSLAFARAMAVARFVASSLFLLAGMVAVVALVVLKTIILGNHQIIPENI